jgi:hypothetical protein
LQETLDEINRLQYKYSAKTLAVAILIVAADILDGMGDTMQQGQQHD